MHCSKTMNRYFKLEKIGEGTYGDVYKGKHKLSNEIVAIKTTKYLNEEEGVPTTVLREVTTLRQLKHPGVVELKDIELESKKIHLIFEYMDMDLGKYISSYPRNKFLDPLLIKSYMKQILKALVFCHQRRILHRDLKPENLLLDSKGNIKVADFGLSRAFSASRRCYTNEVVTLWYRAPELLLGSLQYGSHIDIWSVGCIFSEMCAKEVLFEGDSEIDQILKIFRTLGTPTEETWSNISHFPNFDFNFPKWTKNNLLESVKNMNEKGFDLLQKMLMYEQSRRVSAKAALLHSFFASS